MTVDHLGQAVKRLHPAYGHIPDHVLGRAMKRKFAGMYENFADVQTKNLDANTIPETPRTLAIQLDQLKQGIRRVVFIARGSKVHPNPADFGARKLTLPSGEYYYKPDMIRPQEIIKAVANHELNEILGSATEGYGAPNKERLHPPIAAVVAKSKNGDVAHSALTDIDHAGSAIKASEDLTPNGGSVGIENPIQEIKRRIKPKAGQRWPKV